MRALIADEDIEMAASVADVLASVGFDSVHTRNGSEALRYASEQSFSLVVLDLLLPGTNGYLVCRELRAKRVHTPILVLTGKQGDYDEVEAIESGADDFMRKPFERDVLAARAAGLLRRPAVYGIQALRVGAFSFDPVWRTCTREGEPAVKLTPREARLLEVLAHAEGAPVSRHQLLAEVWGADFEGDPNSIDIYVGYLRKKLGGHSIVTTRGRGFAVVRSAF